MLYCMVTGSFEVPFEIASDFNFAYHLCVMSFSGLACNNVLQKLSQNIVKKMSYT